MDYDIDKLDEKRKKVRDLKNEIKILQNTDDDKKIEDLSQFITNLYKSGGNVSEIVKIDNNLEDFFISYIKHGNTLQPTIAIKNEDSSLNASKTIRSNYSVGSMARQTLIQLCGYLGFLNLIINENRFPLIPILIVDHVSKPFDLVNRAAIGQVFQSFYKKMNKENLQIIIFDDKNEDELNITADHSENLVTPNKTGFNPFYKEHGTKATSDKVGANKDPKMPV